MTQEKRTLVSSCLLVFLLIVVAEKCPSIEDVTPCTCFELGIFGVNIECHKIDNGDLAKMASSLRGREVNSITVVDSKLDFIPHDILKGVKVKLLKIEESTLAALTDRSEAFAGLEDHLEQLDIYKCVFKNEWDWSVLRRLKKLKKLAIIESLYLETLGTDVMKDSVSSSLKYFFFSGNNISFISDHAFESFKDVFRLSLKNNKIKNVKRTMLPNPALELSSLNLSDNLIEQLPDDMFTNMPNLLSVDIGYNKILVLNENTFSSVWKQLDEFSTSGNALLCDCGMSWLLEKTTPYRLNGECASPPQLKGKKLTELESKDFMCYV